MTSRFMGGVRSAEGETAEVVWGAAGVLDAAAPEDGRTPPDRFEVGIEFTGNEDEHSNRDN